MRKAVKSNPNVAFIVAAPLHKSPVSQAQTS